VLVIIVIQKLLKLQLRTGFSLQTSARVVELKNLVKLLVVIHGLYHKFVDPMTQFQVCAADVHLLGCGGRSALLMLTCPGD